MLDQNEWTPQERDAAAELSRMPTQGTPDCLEPEQLLDLIEAQEGQPIAADKMAHIATCPACRHTYFELLNSWRETADLRRQNRTPAATTAAASVLPQTPVPPASEVQQRRRPGVWRPLFASSAGFALGAAAVWLLLVRVPHRQSLPTNSPANKQVAALQRDVEARDLQIAQLEREQRANHQQAQSALAAAFNANLQNQTRERRELQKRLERVALDNEDYRQSAHLLALATVGRMQPDVNATVHRSGSPVADPHEITLLTPRVFAVLGGTPTLACRPLAGATDYHLDIDTEDRSEVLLETLTPTTWRIKTPLHPDATKDRIYKWSVRAMRNAGEVTSQTGQFVVLSQAKQRDLDRMRRKYAHLPLALGLFYWQKGLLKDAEQQFQTCRQNPDKRAIAEALLKQLRANEAL